MISTKVSTHRSTIRTDGFTEHPERGKKLRRIPVSDAASKQPSKRMTAGIARRHDARTSAASEGSRSGRHQLGWKRGRPPPRRTSTQSLRRSAAATSGTLGRQGPDGDRSVRDDDEPSRWRNKARKNRTVFFILTFLKKITFRFSRD